MGESYIAFPKIIFKHSLKGGQLFLVFAKFNPNSLLFS